MDPNKNRNEIGAMTDDGIRFSLFAPRVHQVNIQGSWHDFKSLPMARATDGVWWISFPLSDGMYHYRFEVQQEAEQEIVLVADPTAIRFMPENSDYSLIEILNGQPVYFRYQWQYDDVELPPNEKLIIYEMHIGDFTTDADADSDASGTFARVIEKLDYLAELGITAVELMPVTQSAPEDCWGYSQLSLYAVDNRYGTPDELAQLVDECHKRGIRVIHDGVYNHLHEDAVLAQIDFTYWFYKDNPDKPELHFGPKFNYEYYDETLGVYPAREHALGSIYRWIGTFHMDGIRFDSTVALKHFDVINWFNDEAHHRSGFKPFFTIAEHLPQDPTITGPDGPVDAAWHDNFYRQLNATVLGIPTDDHEPFDLSAISNVLDARADGFASNYNTVRYLNNHDLEREMCVLQKQDLSAEASIRRSKLGTSLLFALPGIPMIWMGEEFGQDSPRGGNTERHPLDWSLLDQQLNQHLWQHYQRLIALRKANPALCSDNIEVLSQQENQGVIAYKRWNDEGQIVIVVANLFDAYADGVEIPLVGIEDGCWHEVIYDYDITSDRNCLVDSFAESEVKIYLKC